MAHFDGFTAELYRAPRRQLLEPTRKAGALVRAPDGLEPDKVDERPDTVLPKPSTDEFDKLAAARVVMPIRMAEPLNARIDHA